MWWQSAAQSTAARVRLFTEYSSLWQLSINNRHKLEYSVNKRTRSAVDCEADCHLLQLALHNSRCYFKNFVVNTAPPNRILFSLRATVSSKRSQCMIDCACIAHFDTRSSALATDSADGADGADIHNNHFFRSTIPTLPKFNCSVFQ